MSFVKLLKQSMYINPCVKPNHERARSQVVFRSRGICLFQNAKFLDLLYATTKGYILLSFFAGITIIVSDLFSGISLQISIPLSTGLLLCPSHALVVGPEQRSLEVIGRILKI